MILLLFLIFLIAIGTQFPRAEKLGKLCKKIVHVLSAGQSAVLHIGPTAAFLRILIISSRAT